MNLWKIMGEVYLVAAFVAFFVALVIEILVRCVSKTGGEDKSSVPPQSAIVSDDSEIAVAIAVAKRGSGK